MEPDVIDDEWEGVHERKDEEGIGYPSVEYLELLMRDAREERDPVRLRRGRTIRSVSVIEGMTGVLERHVQYKRHTCQSHPS